MLHSDPCLKMLRFLCRTRRLFSTELPTANNQQERPSSSSFFTGKPSYYDTLFFLQDVIKNSPSIAATAREEQATLSRQWIKRQALSELLKFNLTEAQHSMICQKLSEIERIAAATGNLDLNALVDSFSTNSSISSSKSIKEQFLPSSSVYADNLGRICAIGRRKTAVAKVYLVDGDGEMLVNGERVTDYFTKMSNLVQIMKPMQVTGTLGKFNVFCKTSCGGLTGQAGAISLGIAKAIAFKDEQMKNLLQKGLHLWLMK